MPPNDSKNLEEEHKKLQDFCASRTDMISISAHQIRTSISAIKWVIKMFLDGDLGQLTPEQENLLRKAYESNEKAIGIVSELLLVNKTENVVEKEYELEKIEMVEVIDNAIFNFSGEAYARGIEVIFLKPEHGSLKVNADKEKISVVMQNLLENAIKYSNMHGKVFITLKHDKENITVSVKDIGIVISEEGKSKIFEKFYRDPDATKKEAIGSGIGLYTVKKIVERHGGKIWFESETGSGTTFYFTIPMSK